MNEVVVKNGIGTPLIGTLAGTGALVASIYGFVSGELSEGLLAYVIAGLVASSAISVWKLLDRRTQLKVGKDGIYCAFWKPEYIYWSQIASVEIRASEDRSFVCLVPVREFWDRNAENNLGKFHVGSSESSRCIKIDNFHLGIDYDKLKSVVESFYSNAQYGRSAS